MFQCLIRTALLLTGLLALPVLLIRAQPYDDHEMRAFLTPPEGCPAPCFIGIRPGVTTIEKAIGILERHEWVAHMRPDYVQILRQAAAYEPPPLISIIHWEWSAEKPQWVNEKGNSGLVLRSRQIIGIHIETIILLGDVLIAFGIPDNGQLIWSERSLFGDAPAYSGWYPEYCMAIAAGGLGTSGNIYRQSVRIQFQLTDTLEANPMTSPHCGQ
jgi:hypothetical protein